MDNTKNNQLQLEIAEMISDMHQDLPNSNIAMEKKWADRWLRLLNKLGMNGETVGAKLSDLLIKYIGLRIQMCQMRH